MQGGDTVVHVAEADLEPGSAWANLSFAVKRTLWFVGFLLLPPAIFLVGVLEFDPLHGAYLAYLLLFLLPRTVRLQPSLNMVPPPPTTSCCCMPCDDPSPGSMLHCLSETRDSSGCEGL